VRLYPANDLANQTGVLTGQVTNLMSGKGRFQFSYQGEMLVGEATRVSGEARKGIASAYGGRGTFARCEYQMSTPYMGAGTCTFSNGAEYQLHVGS
jgi:histone acetyltransferase (RNA polymerase elongator complex component)